MCHVLRELYLLEAHLKRRQVRCSRWLSLSTAGSSATPLRTSLRQFSLLSLTRSLTHSRTKLHVMFQQVIELVDHGAREHKLSLDAQRIHSSVVYKLLLKEIRNGRETKYMRKHKKRGRRSDLERAGECDRRRCRRPRAT